MDLTVLSVPDCPNVGLLEQQLAQVLDGRADVTISRVVVADEQEAVRAGMHGSPTLLVDGIDPFAEPGAPASVSCRLYPGGDGPAGGVPSVQALRQALQPAAPTRAPGLAPVPAATPGPARPAGHTQPTGPIRANSRRLAPDIRGMRSVHRLVLRSFAETGAPPEPAALALAAAPFDPAAVLSDLAKGDHLWLDEAGQISAAYPFAAYVTPHRVEITGGATVHAMCAIDALGIAGMLRTSARIWSRDLVTGEPITVVVDGSRSTRRRAAWRQASRHGATWHPATTVVFFGRSAEAAAGPAALVCCSSINFFNSNATAARWASTHPRITGDVLNQAQALTLASRVFGRLLDPR